MAEQQEIYELKARELSITWGNDSEYWQWETRCEEYAVLKQVWWLNVEGKIAASKIPTFVPYEAAFELEMTPNAEKWSEPIHLELNVPGQNPIKKDVHINGEKEKKFELRLGPIITNSGANGDISFKFYEHSNNNRKKGLIVKKAILRPIMGC